MRQLRVYGSLLIACMMSLPMISQAEDKLEGKPVNITAEVMSIMVKTKEDKQVEIKRNQDNEAVVNAEFARTSRPCPPFCIQPDKLGEVETIAENGLLDYLQKITAGDDTVLVIDSRTPDWVKRGTIPGAINLPWTELDPSRGAEIDSIIQLMQDQFGVSLTEGADAFTVDAALNDGENSAATAFDFSQAKTLVLFCNGMWCGQSPTNIRQLLKMGYPAEKMKWYRGGMQAWNILGLTTVKGGE